MSDGERGIICSGQYFKQIYLKMSFAKCRPPCPDLHVLNILNTCPAAMLINGLVSDLQHHPSSLIPHMCWIRLFVTLQLLVTLVSYIDPCHDGFDFATVAFSIIFTWGQFGLWVLSLRASVCPCARPSVCVCVARGAKHLFQNPYCFGEWWWPPRSNLT